MSLLATKDIKKELQQKSNQELIDICLQLSRMKVTNKELLLYNLFEQYDEQAYIEKINEEANKIIEDVNARYIYIAIKKYRKAYNKIIQKAKYSKNKGTKIEVQLHLAQQIKSSKVYATGNIKVKDYFQKLIIKIEKDIAALHNDLQYDYTTMLKAIK